MFAYFYLRLVLNSYPCLIWMHASFLARIYAIDQLDRKRSSSSLSMNPDDIYASFVGRPTGPKAGNYRQGSSYIESMTSQAQSIEKV